MNCTKCGSAMPNNSTVCPECGQPVKAAAASVSTAAEPVASLKYLKCPSCDSGDFTVLRAKGAIGKAAVGAAFGAIGNLVVGGSAARNTETPPLQYKCNACKKKYESLPLSAPVGDILSIPCTVNFERLSSMVGAAVPQIVYLNGIKIGPVKNGKSISFQTSNKHNILFVTDQYGVVFQSYHRFEAQPGGSVSVRFKLKFK